MFGHRPDGKKVKNLSPLFRVIPCVMPERSDAQVYFKQDISLTPLDNYIDKKAEEGIKLSYMNIIFAAVIRIIAERPQLNRFVINGVLYERNSIEASLVIKKSLSDEGEESTLKMPFTGNENIFEVGNIVNSYVEKNKNISAATSTDKLVKLLGLIPDFLFRSVVRFLMFLDKHNAMPKAIINASPFHTSVFITNVGSLGIDTIYHHIYNFGTTSMFFAMGKKKKSYIYDDDEIREEKCITVAFVGDERICDGYYFANSFKQLSRYLKKPELLETPLEKEEDTTVKEKV